MKRSWLITILVCLLLLAGGWIVVSLPNVVPKDNCSDLYRQYAGAEGIKATFVKDYRVNDSLSVDVTELNALDSSGWDTLISRYFKIPLMKPEKASFERKDWETARLAPRGDISMPTDTVFENNVLLILSNERKSLYVFHTETREQITAIMTMRFKALKIKKQLNLLHHEESR